MSYPFLNRAVQMPIVHQLIQVETHSGIGVYNITSQIIQQLDASPIGNGQVLVFCCHTTTALAINEDEERLIEDIKVHRKTLAPPEGKYLHNDLHLRDVPPNEPINAHSHLMAMMLNNSEVIPVVDRKLALGTWQSVLFLELDGPRTRKVSVQISGEV